MKSFTAMLAAAAAFAAAGFSGTVIAQDVEAARALAQQNNCMQCHGLRNDKDAPSFLKIAEKYRPKPNGLEEVMKHMTAGAEVKLADGTKEKHKIAATIPPNDAAQLRNLARFILSVQPK